MEVDLGLADLKVKQHMKVQLQQDFGVVCDGGDKCEAVAGGGDGAKMQS